MAGRYDDAFELFKHCEQLKPDASEVLYELGCYHLSMNEPENGTNYLVRAVQLAPDNIYFKEALASHYLRVRDKKSAAPLLEDMVRCNPSRSDVLAQLVNIYLGEKNYEAAIKALDRIETLEGRNLNISMEKFRLYREMGELEKGFTELEALAADNPNDLTFKVIIGDQYMIQQQEDKAKLSAEALPLKHRYRMLNVLFRYRLYRKYILLLSTQDRKCYIPRERYFP